MGRLRCLRVPATIAAALLLTACSGASPPTSQASSATPVPGGSASPPPATPAGGGGGGGGDGQAPVDRCHTGGLSLTAVGAPGAGAGNVIEELGLRNTGSTPCWFFGYVGMAMLDASGNQLPTNVVRDTGSRFPWTHVSQFTVQPGDTAPFWVHWEDVPVGSETSCPTSSGLIVTPPDETTQVHLGAFQATACNHGELDVSPMMPPGTKGP